MRYLEYLKKYTYFDLFIVLMDDLNYTDDEITAKLEISKQSIYDARKRLAPLIEALNDLTDKPDPRNKDVQAVIDTFKDLFGTTASNSYDRYAAKRLIDKHTTETIVTVIKALAHYGDQEYAPTVNSVRELEKKLVTVMSFLRKQKGNQVVDL